MKKHVINTSGLNESSTIYIFRPDEQKEKSTSYLITNDQNASSSGKYQFPILYENNISNNILDSVFKMKTDDFPEINDNENYPNISISGTGLIAFLNLNKDKTNAVVYDLMEKDEKDINNISVDISVFNNANLNPEKNRLNYFLICGNTDSDGLFSTKRDYCFTIGNNNYYNSDIKLGYAENDSDKDDGFDVNYSMFYTETLKNNDISTFIIPRASNSIKVRSNINISSLTINNEQWDLNNASSGSKFIFPNDSINISNIIMENDSSAILEIWV